MKSKKTVIALCAVMLVVAVICLCGCEILESLLGHLHTVDFSTYQSNSTKHWHECSECGERFGEAEHTFNGGDKCTVCGKIANTTDPENPNENTGEKPDEKPDDPTKPDPSGNGSEKFPPEEPVPVVPPEEPISAMYIAERANSTYGYDWLLTQPNGENLQQYYRKIDFVAQKVWDGTAELSAQQASGRNYQCTSRVETTDLSLEEVKAVYSVYCFDHPYNFWQSQTQLTGYISSTLMGTTNYCYIIVLDAFANHEALMATKNILDENIKSAYAKAAGSLCDYDTVLAYYTELALSGDYAFAAENVPSDEYWAHSIVGLFDNDTNTNPVCEGYSRAFQLLLNLRGIQNVFCVGHALNMGTGGGGGHAWNMVKLEDEKWYYFDLTWDDNNDADGNRGGTLNYDYFAVCDNLQVYGYQFATTHLAGNKNNANGFFLYDLPAASANEYSGAAFAVGKVYQDENFVYMRNGMSSVTINRILTSAATVKIPQTVKVGERVFVVTAIGPYISGNTCYTVYKNVPYTRTVIIPQTVTTIGMAAFYCSGRTTIWYEGTREMWSQVAIGRDAFLQNPIILCQGEWSLN